MDLIAKDSGGHNVVAREGAAPHWYPPEAAPAVVVDVWRKNIDQPYEEATHVGSFPPGASVEFDFTPLADRNLQLAAISRSAHGTPSVSRLSDAVWATLLFDRGDGGQPASDSVDDAVPVVTQAPTVTKSDSSDDWAVFMPDADAKGYSVYAGEVEVQRASNNVLLRTIPFRTEVVIYVPCWAFDCKLRYRRRNQYRLGGSDGWSAWSPWADAFGLASETGGANPVESAQVSFDSDPNDVKNPQLRETLYGQ
jgi:hypothetical protein